MSCFPFIVSDTEEVSNLCVLKVRREHVYLLGKFASFSFCVSLTISLCLSLIFIDVIRFYFPFVLVLLFLSSLYLIFDIY